MSDPLPSRIKTLADVVDWRLCLGCGACAYICPQQAVQLVDLASEGIRPSMTAVDCGGCTDCLRVCPGIASDYRRTASSELPDPELALTSSFEAEWGPVLEIWEGHASDPAIRFQGSSGGALTALSAYCIEQGGMHGVLHTGADPDDPVRNRTRLSLNRSELIAATGSRYSPASICDGLAHVEQAPAPCVVIGKPVEIAAVRKAEDLRPGLKQKVGLTLSFFCAESPSTRGTIELLKRMAVPVDDLAELRYRGQGWPGHFAPTRKGQTAPAGRMTYRESWAFLQAHRPWAAHLWPDGAGELADISCGDPWYEEPDGKNPGFSLVVVRTAAGRRILHAAMDAGYLTLRKADATKLARSQPGLLDKKGSVWGRRLALQLLGLPTTRFPGLALAHCWRRLPLKDKIRSTFGTFRRALAKRLYRRANFSAVAKSSSAPGAVRVRPIGSPAP